MITYTLSEDVTSYSKGRIYGKKGDIVTLIIKYGEVFIVESMDGDRYSITAEMVTPKESPFKEPEIFIQPGEVKAKKTRPILSNNQTTLF